MRQLVLGRGAHNLRNVDAERPAGGGMARPAYKGLHPPRAFPVARQPGSDRWRSGSGPLGPLAAVQLYTSA